MSKKARKRPPTARASTALANRSNRPQITPYIQNLMDGGHVHMQRWSPRMWQLALDQGEDPQDARSYLYGGTPSDAASYAPAPAPKTASIAAEQRVSSVAALPATSIQKLIAATENLRKFAASAYAASATTTRVMRDPATGSVIVERRR